MLSRGIYNLVLYYILTYIIPMLDIRTDEVKFWFLVWVIAAFNIVITGTRKTQYLTLLAAFIFVPFLVAGSIDNLMGNTTNFFNVSISYIRKSQDLYYKINIGYVYMAISTLILTYIKVYRKPKQVQPVPDNFFKQFLREKLS